MSREERRKEREEARKKFNDQMRAKVKDRIAAGDGDKKIIEILLPLAEELFPKLTVLPMLLALIKELRKK